MEGTKEECERAYRRYVEDKMYTGVCDWMYPTTKKEWYLRTGGPCYSVWPNVGGKISRQNMHVGIRGAMTGCKADVTRWFNYLFLDSPCHEAFILPEGEMPVPGDMVLMNADASVFMVHHAANIARIHSEHASFLPVWTQLTKWGMCRDIAYLLSLSLSCRGVKIEHRRTLTHAALSSHNLSTYGGWLRRKKVCDGTGSFLTKTSYTGHGKMWEDTGLRGTMDAKAELIFPLFSKQMGFATSTKKDEFGYSDQYIEITDDKTAAEFVRKVEALFCRVLKLKKVSEPKIGEAKYVRS